MVYRVFVTKRKEYDYLLDRYGGVYFFCSNAYKNGNFNVSDRNGCIGGISKIMYIPAERSIVSVAENKSKLLKELPDSSETFSDEFVNAKKFFHFSSSLHEMMAP